MSSKLLFQGKYIRLLDLDGWEYTERVVGSGIAMIVPVNSKNKLIFVEQYRPAVDQHVVEFPMGIVGDLEEHRQETVEEGAIRELEEETGYRAGRVRHFYHGPMNQGANSGLFDYYFADQLEKVSEGGGDETESIVIHEIPHQEVDQWLSDIQTKGKLVDPRVFTGLYFFNKFQKEAQL